MRGPALGRRRRSWPFGILVAACVVMLVVLLGLGDYLALDHRLGRIDITPTSGAGDHPSLAGSDSRADLPAGTNVYGTTADAPGQRAGVLVFGHTSTPARLTLTLQQPQMLVDSLCNLGIPTNHLAMVGMAGFAKVIDALGGVTVTVPYPVTDAYTGLEIPTAGTQKLTGVQALALVRSRHPEELVNGAWVQAADAAGTQDRTEWAGRVFHAT